MKSKAGYLASNFTDFWGIGEKRVYLWQTQAGLCCNKFSIAMVARSSLWEKSASKQKKKKAEWKYKIRGFLFTLFALKYSEF